MDGREFPSLEISVKLDLRAVFADTLRLGVAAFTFVLPVGIVKSLTTSAWHGFGPGAGSESGALVAVNQGVYLVLGVLATLLVMPGLLERLERPEASRALRFDALRMLAPPLVAGVVDALPYVLAESRLIERHPPVAVLLPMLLLAGVSIWLKARLFIVLPVAVRERGGVRATLRRSWQLTRGAALRILFMQGAFLVPALFAWWLGHSLEAHGLPHGEHWVPVAVFVMLWPFDLALQAVIHRDLLRQEAGASSVLPAAAPA
jgi:hypothetical protein